MRSSYQVFISFKHTDERGKVTKDYEIAKRLYDILSQHNLSVFFSEASIQQEGAANYSKLIDDALDSSSILILVLTDARYADAEWISYELNGFNNDVRSGLKPNGQVVSLVDGVSLKDLPRSLRMHQTYDVNQDGYDRLLEMVLNYFKKYGTGNAKEDTIPVPQSILDTKDSDSDDIFSIPSMRTGDSGKDLSSYEAVRWLTRAAMNNDVDAQYRLGLYYEGESPFKSFKWFSKAAENGNIDAQFKLGVLYREESFEDAVKWFTKAAENGSREAQYELGMMFKDKSPLKSFSWMNKSAENGYPQAQYEMWNFLKDESEEEALEWLEKSGGNGYIEAQLELWEFYKDKEEGLSIKWLTAAATNDHKPSQRELGMYYIRKEDVDNAKKWLTMSAENGDVDAQFELGRFLLDHEPDRTDAVKWLNAAEDSGMSEARDILWTLFTTDEETDQLAFDWFTKSAEKGDVSAQYELGRRKEKVSEQEALKWLYMAMKNGNTDAEREMWRFVDEDLPQEDAEEWIKEIAEEGCSEAEYRYAVILEADTTIDGAANIWYMRAADQGHTKAQFRAYQLMKEKDPSRCDGWLRQAAEAGLAEAQYEFALKFESTNRDTWYRWMSRAAENGNPPAQYEMWAVLADTSEDEALEWLTKSGENGFAEAQLELWRHYEEIDEEEALKWLETAANSGHIESMYELGMYNRRIGNDEGTKEWLTKAAEKGLIISQYDLGMFYIERGGDRMQAIKWLRTAEDAGMLPARDRLWELFSNEKTTDASAFDWFTKAAEKGDVGSQYELGRRKEKISEQDALFWLYAATKNGNAEAEKELWTFIDEEVIYENGVKWVRERASEGYAEAEYRYANLLEANPFSEDKPEEWYIRAADHGQPQAQFKAYQLKIDTDPTRAKAWLRQAAENGIGDAQFELALEYVDTDKNEWLRWMSKAADNGRAEAEYAMGMINREKNPEKAFEWFQKAAEKDRDESMYELGRCYELGIGTEPSIEDAVRCYAISASNNTQEVRSMFKSKVAYVGKAAEALERLGYDYSGKKIKKGLFGKS